MELGSTTIPRKLIEAGFRRFWVALIPVIVAPLVVLALVHHPVVYESSSSVWVSSLSDLSQTAPATSRRDPEDTPASRQVIVLKDLLSTWSFREAVALDAGLVSAAATADERAAAGYAAGAHIAALVGGPNLVIVKASAATPAQAQRLVLGVLNQYQARTAADRVRENAVVLGYFEKAVASAQVDLAATRADAAAYLKLNPTFDKTPTAESLRLADRVAAAQSLVDRLVKSQQDAQLTAASSSNTSAVTFAVQDAPSLPASPLGTPLLKRLGYPLAGVVFGLLVAAALIYASYRSDHTVRSREDLAALDVSLLGYVPDLKPSTVYARFTPLRWAGFGRRDYGRRVAASLSPRQKAAS